jgi:hypothetical protein
MMRSCGARAVTAVGVLGVRKSAASRIYMEIHGHPSPSGQTPSDNGWVFRSPRNNAHFTIFFALFLRAHKNLKNGGETDVKLVYGSALTHSMAVYRQMCLSLGEEPTLTIERADPIMKQYLHELRRTGDPDLCEFRLMKCKKCSTYTTETYAKVTSVCATCSGLSLRGRRANKPSLLATEGAGEAEGAG